jgi:hypothetical protein
MSTDPSVVTRRWTDIFPTSLLLVTHAFLVMYTLWAADSVINNEEYMESRCQIHHLDCSEPWRTNGAWIAAAVSVLLMVLDIVLVIWRVRKRRRSFLVPLLCCIGQFVVIGAFAAVASQ